MPTPPYDTINVEPRLEITLFQLIATLSQLGIQVVGDVPSVSLTQQSCVIPDKNKDAHPSQSTPKTSRSNPATPVSGNCLTSKPADDIPPTVNPKQLTTDPQHHKSEPGHAHECELLC
jgi:hypothetical protein